MYGFELKSGPWIYLEIGGIFYGWDLQDTAGEKIIKSCAYELGNGPRINPEGMESPCLPDERYQHLTSHLGRILGWRRSCIPTSTLHRASVNWKGAENLNI